MRLRIWTACIVTALLGAAGVLGVAGTFLPVSTGVSPELVAALPWIAAGIPLLAGVVFALWLARGIVRPLRDIGRAAALEDDRARAALERLPGWGEIGSISAAVRTLLERLASCQHELEELRAERGRLESAHAELSQALARVAAEEGVPPAAAADEPAAESVQQALAERGARASRERAQLRERIVGVGSELAHDLTIAREAVEHAERGFVEATGMLSGVRELERLLGEIESSVGNEGAEDAGQRDALDGFRDAASRAIEELATRSAESVQRLASGLRRVQEIAQQVQVLGNRATLIALEAAMRGSPDPAFGDSLKSLTRDAQAATARTDELAREVDREVSAASEQMRDVGRRTAEALAGAPRPAESPSRGPELPHLVERLRDTLSEASGRAERLAASGERASSAMERLARRLEADARALDEVAGALESPREEGS